ncbi:MAG: threonine transporter RhtB [Piscirickettsiaceae bacterium]|nr:MAG: threonine transporter RhtB [Piscirickettsiaceae bacterium]PCI69967.1 MAG: threonine transporter RhtB [Piscirickettsiaceae bacterium]
MLFESFLVFFFTTMIIILSPGPAVLIVVSTAVSNSLRQAFYVILGIAVADMSYFVMSALGIVALILASDVLFTTIKWAGVAYLTYLGLRTLFSSSDLTPVKTKQEKNKKFLHFFVSGYILEISNPKALLYFSALLPQFIDVSEPMIQQLLVLGGAVFVLDIICYSLYAYLGSSTSAVTFSTKTKRLLKRCSGGLLVLAGIKMATFAR